MSFILYAVYVDTYNSIGNKSTEITLSQYVDIQFFFFFLIVKFRDLIPILWQHQAPLIAPLTDIKVRLSAQVSGRDQSKIEWTVCNIFL